LETITLNGGIEVRAGQIPFRTDQGLDVLPIEAVAYFKQKDTPQDAAVTEYYKQLYASYKLSPGAEPNIELYRTAPLEGREGSEVSISEDTSDHSLWIALLTRANDKPAGDTESDKEKLRDTVREKIAGKTISLGVVPAMDESGQHLAPGGAANAEAEALLRFSIPNAPNGLLADDRTPNTSQ
jgi:hypothetical protein